MTVNTSHLSRKVLLRKIMKHWRLYLMLIPFLAYYWFFYFRPMGGLTIAFKDYSIFKGAAASPWVGLEYFKEFLTNPSFLLTLKNTLTISILNLVFGFPLPIILAIALNEVKNRHFKKTVQTVTYLPHFISMVVIAGITVNLLSPSNGLINIIIEMFGGEKVYFLSKPEWFRPVYIIMHLWKETGFGAVVFIAALAGIDPALYEAAVVDGATRMQRIIHVTLPGLMPTIIILLILRVGRMINVGHEAVILLYQPATYSTADVINTYVYRIGLLDARYDYATAVGLFNSLVSLLLVIVSNKIAKKTSETSLW